MPDVFVSPKKEQAQAAKASPETITRAISPLTSFCKMPDGVSFANQHANEVVILFLRRHLVTNVPWIVVAMLLLFIPPLFDYVLQATSFPITFLPGAYVFTLTLFYYIIVFAFVLTNFMSWFYNIGLVTTQRIVDIDFSDIVFHDVAITKLSQVEEVKYVQIGFIRTFFNFGDVIIETASDTNNFEFLAVPTPGLATDIIGELLGEGGTNE